MTKNELKELFAQGPVDFKFTKVDGTSRTMLATTSDEFVPQRQDASTEIRKTKVEEAVYSVWDIENNGWRSFRWSSVTEVNEEPTTISDPNPIS